MDLDFTAGRAIAFHWTHRIRIFYEMANRKRLAFQATHHRCHRAYRIRS
uniref:Uncharacterized protein n=1 Tax=Parascaris equorum TaxID=6256 RepID=A0A914RZC2_PAREQ